MLLSRLSRAFGNMELGYPDGRAQELDGGTALLSESTMR